MHILGMIINLKFSCLRLLYPYKTEQCKVLDLFKVLYKNLPGQDQIEQWNNQNKEAQCYTIIMLNFLSVGEKSQ